MASRDHLLEIIAACSDLKKLQNWVKNATREGAADLADAARRRMIEVEARRHLDGKGDGLALDFWKSIIALEQVLSNERGKTTRLARTRQKIARVGVHKTLVDLVMQPTPSEGYVLLKDRDMLDMSAEAVVLRFLELFEANVVLAAKARRTSDGLENT